MNIDKELSKIQRKLLGLSSHPEIGEEDRCRLAAWIRHLHLMKRSLTKHGIDPAFKGGGHKLPIGDIDD